VYVSERPDLLIELLKREWSFDGVVMSDWFATHSTAEAANGGMDLEMPGPTRHRGEKLVEAVRGGQVDAEVVRESARRVLRLIGRVGAFDDPAIADEQAIDRPEHRALIRQAGAEGIVLLKNDGVLPLDRSRMQKIALIGPNAKTAQIMGGGSAQVNAHYRVSPYEGIAAHVGDAAELSYELGATNYKLLPLLPEPVSVEYFNSRDLSGPIVTRTDGQQAEIMWFHEVAPGVDPEQFSARLATQFTPAESGEHQFSLVSAGLSRLLVDGRLVVDNWDAWQAGETYFGAGSAEATGTIDLAAGQTYAITVEYAYRQTAALGLRAVRAGVTKPLGEDAIERAVQVAAAADVALLCVGLNGEWDTEGQDRPHIDLPGRQNELIARVAAVNPRTIVVLQTGAPVTMPWLEQTAGVLEAWYPGQEAGNAIADVLFGVVNPSGKLPQTFPKRLADDPTIINYPGENGRVRYGEGIFVGYRYYEKKQIEPLFPFGYGLSYTSFAYNNLRLSAEQIGPDDQLIVSIDVTNTGDRAGQEIVQAYVRDVAAAVARPDKELKAADKIALEPGETRTVALALDRRSLAYWDDAQHAWVAEAGAFEVQVGSSSLDIRVCASFELTETAVFGGAADHAFGQSATTDKDR
jgi:beta-glucosidase